MKWFHHECAARHDPKLQILGSTHGAEGLGIFWGLLEEIGQHSDTFHLKVLGISEEADNSFMNLLQDMEPRTTDLFGSSLDISRVPRLPLKILAKNLFSSSKKLTAVIRTSVEAGLFDPQKWLKFNVLYSPSFEQRADDYTRRLHKKTDTVRTHSEQSSDNIRRLSEDCPDNIGQTPESLRTNSKKLLLETEEEQIQKENRDRTEKDLLVKDAGDIHKFSTQPEIAEPAIQTDRVESGTDLYLIALSDSAFEEYAQSFRSEIANWNDDRSNRFDWVPLDSELRKLFLGGSDDYKLRMCYHAYNILTEKVNYPELVLRALRLMLKASEKTRITNPFAWMWTCLHGNGNGTLPWVQLLTADEENSLASILRRRVRDNHPP